MKIVGFRIGNHARVADSSVEVRQHLVLVGPNEAGKSSVLRCINFVLGATTAQLYAQIGAADVRDRDLPFVVEVVLSSFTDQDKALFPDEITVDAATGAETLMLRLEVTVEVGETLSIRRWAPDGGTGRQLSRDQLQGLGWHRPDLRGGNRGGRNTSLDDMLRSVELGSEREGFEGVFDQLESLLAASKVLGNLRGRLADQLSRALTSPLEKSDVVLVSGASAERDVLSDVRLQLQREGTFRDLDEVSDGTLALLNLAVINLNTALANFVAIDEPETHLHPASQRNLARLLMGGANQKILATHSADIVGAFPPECIVTVKPGGILVQAATDLLSANERLALRWWVRDRLEPLTATKIAGVEGISDRIILERAAELTGRELDRLGVSVLETDGSGDMAAIIKLFGPSGFDIPMSLLIDHDAVSRTAQALNVQEADLAAHSVWVSIPDLEAEYVAALGADVVWAAIVSSNLFSQNQLGNCQCTGPAGKRTSDDVAAFCGNKKYKVSAAIAVTKLLTATSARAIVSIEALLSDLSSRRC